jgi:glycosyltransferase involved in cell wall biosynthesis
VKLLFSDDTLPYLLRDAEFPVGGWAVQLCQLLRGLKAIGHTAGVLTWKGANAHVGPQPLCDLVESYDRAKGIPKLRLIYSWFPSLVRAIRHYRPDVVIQSCSGFDTGLIALAAQVVGVPFVHRIASDRDADERVDSYLSQRDRMSFHYGLKSAELIICQNAYQLHHIRNAFPAKSAEIIYNTIELPDAVAQPIPQMGRRYVAWIGVFKQPKNLPLLLKIAQEMPHVRFRVAGAPAGDLNAGYSSAIEGLKKQQNVELLGYVRRVAIADLLAGATVLLSTSDYEGFSNTYLEALAVGTPIVTRACVDPDGIIARHRLGFVAQDEHRLAGGIAEILALDSESYGSLAMRCQSYVSERHSTIEAARRLVAILESAM